MGFIRPWHGFREIENNKKRREMAVKNVVEFEKCPAVSGAEKLGLLEILYSQNSVCVGQLSVHSCRELIDVQETGIKDFFNVCRARVSIDWFPLSDMISPDYVVEFVQKSKEAFEETGKFRICFSFMGRNKKNVYLELTASVLSRGGRSIEWIGYVREVDERQMKTQLAAQVTKNERGKVVGRLQDEVAQNLVLLNFYLNQLTAVEGNNLEGLSQIRYFLDESLKKTRSLCYYLEPPGLEVGFLEGITSLSERMELPGLSVASVNYSDIKEDYFEEENKYYLLAILREFIENSVEHSGCTSVMIEIYRIGDSIILSVSDNGKYINLREDEYESIKIRMEKMSELVSAELELSGQPEKGNFLEIKLPVSTKKFIR